MSLLTSQCEKRCSRKVAGTSGTYTPATHLLDAAGVLCAALLPSAASALLAPIVCSMVPILRAINLSESRTARSTPLGRRRSAERGSATQAYLCFGTNVVIVATIVVS